MQKLRDKQVAQGLVVGIWIITGEEPTRGPRGLEWDCHCNAGHLVRLPHHALQYNAGVPEHCPTCLHEGIERRAQEQAEERRIGTEFRNAQQAARLAQLAQQSLEGIDANAPTR